MSVKIPISTSEAQRSLKQLRKDLRNVGLSAKDTTQDAKKLEDKLKQKFGAEKAKRATDNLARSLKLTKRELIAMKLRAGDVSGAFGIMGGKMKSMTKSLMGLRTAMISVAGIALFGMLIKKGAQFEQTMAAVKGITGATEKQFKSLTGIAKRLGETTEFTATQAAEGLKFLSMAGFEVAKAIAALPGVLDLATAGQLDLGEAADITTNALTAMRLNVNQLNNVNDTFVKTITTSNTDIRMLAESFKYSAPLAAGLGYDIQKLSSWIGLLGNAGIQGSMAGTQLNAAFQRLPKVFDKYGVSLRRADGSTKDLTDAVELLERRGAETEEVMKLFAARGGRAMLAFLGMGSSKMREYERLIRLSEGESKRLANTMRNTTVGAFKELMSAIEGVQISAFEAQTGDLNVMIKGLTKTVRENKDAILAFVNMLGKSVYNLGKAFIYMAGAYNKFLDLFYGPIGGNAKKEQITFLENEGKLLQRRLEVLDRMMVKNPELMAQTRALIETNKEKIALAKEELKLTEKISVAEDSWLTKEQKFPKNIAYYQAQWDEEYRMLEEKIEATEKAWKVESEYRAWKKQEERDATYGTTKSLAEARKVVKEYEKEIEKEKQKAIDKGLKYAEKAEKDSWLVRHEMVEKFTEQRLKIEEEMILKMEEEYKHFLENIHDETADVFYDIFSGALDNFKDFADRMKNYFLRVLSEMAAQAVVKPIVVPIVGSIAGALGLPGKAMAGAGGVGDILGIGKLLGGLGLGGIGAGATATVGGSLAGSGLVGVGTGGMYGPAGAVSAATGTALSSTLLGALGPAALGGLGYSMVGGMLGLPQSKYSGLTAGAGAGIGFLAGGPIGAAAGALLGGLLGSTLGGSDRETVQGKFRLTPSEEELFSLTQTKSRGGGGKATRQVIEAQLAPYRELFKGMPKDEKQALLTMLGVEQFGARARGSEKHLEDRFKKSLSNMAEDLDKFLEDVFMDFGKKMGFSTMEGMMAAMEEQKAVLGDALMVALDSGSFLLFKSTIAERIYNSITEGLVQAMISSSFLEQSLLPVYGKIQETFAAATAGGGFDIGIFREGIGGAIGNLGSIFNQMKPAFDEIASLGQMIREMFIGQFQTGGIVPKTGLAMVHEGEHISPEGGNIMNLTINADIVTTDNVRSWMRDVLEDMGNYREGRPLQRFDLQTAGINVS